MFGVITFQFLALFLVYRYFKQIGWVQFGIAMFVLRLILYLFSEYVFNPGIPGMGKNSEAFWEAALISLDKERDWSYWLDFSVEYWPKILALIAYTFGEFKVNGITLVALISTLSLRSFYLLGTEIYSDRRIVKRMVLLYGSLPYTVALSAGLLRESLITLLLIHSVYMWLKYTNHGGVKNLLMSYLLCCLAAIFHGGVLIVIIAYMILSIFKKGSLISTMKMLVRTSAITLIIVPIVYSLEIGRSKLYSIYRLIDNSDVREIDKIESIIGNTADWYGIGQYRYDFDFTGVASVLLELPEIFLPFYFYPYPWSIALISYLNGILSIAFLWPLAVRRGLIFSNSNRRHLIFIASLLLIVYAFGTSEYAAAVRHRHKLLPFLIMAIMPFYRGIPSIQKNSDEK